MSNVNYTSRTDLNPHTNERCYKGESLFSFPDIFVVLDIETTGLSSRKSEIIEVSAVKVSNDIVIDTFSTLLKPNVEIPKQITIITGITNNMVKDSPKFAEIENDLRAFLGNNIILGHNINFDINFLYDNFSTPFGNNFVDTMRLSREILPQLEHHKLKDLSEYYGIDYSKAHRAMEDCLITLEVYRNMKKQRTDGYSGAHLPAHELPQPQNRNKRRFAKNLKAAEMCKSEEAVPDKSNPLFGRVCVFTGELGVERREAMQYVLDIGGFVADSVTKKTDVLIADSGSLGKTGKYKKAMEYIAVGKNIEIIDGKVFLDIMKHGKDVET